MGLQGVSSDFPAAGADALTREALTREAMTHEALTHEAMTHEAMTHEAMTHEAMTHEAMTHEALTHEALARQISELGEWFHNIDLHGIQTAPNHFLGDFPNVKWRHIAPALPEDLSGATVLDIGCNGGFYSLQMKQRGAKRVLGIDICERYLEQARLASRTLGLEIELEKRSVYEVDQIAGQFDFVIFMGVLYHLRYPLYALDKVVTKVGGRLVFQTMIRGSEEVKPWEPDYDFWRKEMFADPSWPQMYFIEQSYSNDQTNWWIPNRAAAEAMLRSSGLEIESHPENETWICRPDAGSRAGRFVHAMEMDGTL